MDPKEEQENELLVLESVYNNELEVICKTYPNIEVKLTFPTVPEGAQHYFTPEYLFDVSLIAKLPKKYPDDLPILSLKGLTEGLNEEANNRLLQELNSIAEQNLGMPMVYAVASELTDKLEKLVKKTAHDKMEAEMDARRQEEEQAFKEYEADKVTVESFAVWRQAFEEEMRPMKEAMKKALKARTEGRLTGKQMFLQDQLLGISDLKLIENDKEVLSEEFNDKLVVDGMDVDESLFQDDVELPDSDED
uniref:RWD domain-containing protein n=1 Tax=Panagrolaimus superbus TaxID=310955 RepID=A0A914YMM7_9BILA